MTCTILCSIQLLAKRGEGGGKAYAATHRCTPAPPTSCSFITVILACNTTNTKEFAYEALNNKEYMRNVLVMYREKHRDLFTALKSLQLIQTDLECV